MDIRNRNPLARSGFDPRFDRRQGSQVQSPTRRVTPTTSTSPTQPRPSAPTTTTTSRPTGPVAQAPKPAGGLDSALRDIAGRVGGEIGAIQGRQKYGNILGIPERRGRDIGTTQGQQMYDRAKQTLGGLLKQDYEYDNFDIILEHLIQEGYTNSEESAIAIMANMSENWRQTILEYSGGGGASPNVPNVVVSVVDKLGNMFASKKPVKKQTPDGFKPHQKFN